MEVTERTVKIFWEITPLVESAGRDRYHHILRAAEGLFADKGYSNVSIEEIAKTAGVSKGLVSYHFGSKERLLKQILRSISVPLAERFDAILISDETVRVKLRAMVQAVIEASESQRDAVRAITFEKYITEVSQRPFLAIREKNRNRISKLIEEGIATGELRHVDIQLTASYVGGIIREILTRSARSELPLPEDATDKITALLLDGMVN